jgi:hypothetical protein
MEEWIQRKVRAEPAGHRSTPDGANNLGRPALCSPSSLHYHYQQPRKTHVCHVKSPTAAAATPQVRLLVSGCLRDHVGSCALCLE